MEYLKDNLQKDIFKRNSERLFFVAHVYRMEKRKKHSFLCISLSPDGNLPLLSKIKSKDNNFKRCSTWPLNTLIKVDGHYHSKDLSCDLFFDKIYTWLFENLDDKEAFLSTLFKICRRYLSADGFCPNFLNVPDLDEDTYIKRISQAYSNDDNDLNNDPLSYQLISKKEEKDLEMVIKDFSENETMFNIEKLTDNLTKELSLLDGANIYKLMGSELEMNGLMNMIDHALSEVDIIEKKLTDWDETCLNSIRSHMEMMDEKDTYIHTIDKNKNSLKNELGALIDSLDFPDHMRKILADGDISDLEHIKEFNRAAFELQKASNYIKNSAALSKMKAVRECLEDFESIKNNFGNKISTHLSKLFFRIQRKLDETYEMIAKAEKGTQILLETLDPFKLIELYKINKLPLKRKLLMESIYPYRDLIRWLKLNCVEIYNNLINNYVSTFGEALRKDVRHIISTFKKMVSENSSFENQSLSNSNYKGVLSETQTKKISTLHISKENVRENWLKDVLPTKSTEQSNVVTEFCFLFSSLLDFLYLLLSFEENIFVNLLDVSHAQDFNVDSLKHIPTDFSLFRPLNEESRKNVVGRDVDKKIEKLSNDIPSTQINKDSKSELTSFSCVSQIVPQIFDQIEAFLYASDKIDKFNSLRAIVIGISTVERMKYSIQQTLTASKAYKADNLTSGPSPLHTTPRGGSGKSDLDLLLFPPTFNLVYGYATSLTMDCVIVCRNFFEQLMADLLTRVKDVKDHVKKYNKIVSKNANDNVFTFVTQFPGIICQMEEIFSDISLAGGTDKVSGKSTTLTTTLTTNVKIDKLPLLLAYKKDDIETWYVAFVRAIFASIELVAKEQTRLPPNLVAFVNFHAMFTMLSTLKIYSNRQPEMSLPSPSNAAIQPFFENDKKDARLRYKAHLQSYVECILDKPLEKLTLFFDGVEQRIAQGVKESEIGYQTAFNKIELRKVIKEYPGKEIKKKLDNLYNMVQRHIGEDSSLMQVVWRSVQEEFIKIYKSFETMIYRCYPDTGITLEFTLNELLGYFSEIALRH